MAHSRRNNLLSQRDEKRLIDAVVPRLLPISSQEYPDRRIENRRLVLSFKYPTASREDGLIFRYTCLWQAARAITKWGW